MSSLAAPALRAEQVAQRFRNGRGVGPVDLELGKGEILALVGPNGSGKTTLLRCLATRNRPRQGSISWFGDSNRERARSRLAVVFDATAHADELSARDNLGFFASVRGVSASEAEGVLVAAELAEVAGEPVASYSYGMRRRLLLAEALVGNPDLMLLDEPTLGLDVAGQRWLGGVLKDRARTGGAVCISTNDTEFVEAVASRVCFLVEGRLVQDATVPDLLSSLGGTREIRISCRGPLPLEVMSKVLGVEGVAPIEGGLLVLARQRDGLLAELLSILGGLDQSLVDLSVREPGLADCFLRLTGRTLSD